jgi:hypothetical protein
MLAPQTADSHPLTDTLNSRWVAFVVGAASDWDKAKEVESGTFKREQPARCCLVSKKVERKGSSLTYSPPSTFYRLLLENP